MKIRFITRFTLHSFIAMAISWVVSIVIIVSFDGTGDYNEMVSYGALFSGFVLLTWGAMIFPFVWFINDILKRSSMRIYFPFLSLFYALFAFLVGMSIFLDVKTALNMLIKFNILAVTAGLIGFLWGLLYMLLYLFEHRRSYAN